MSSLTNPSLDPVFCFFISTHFLAACIGLVLLLVSVPSNLLDGGKYQRTVSRLDSPIDRRLIFPGRISHTRMFPNHHSFTYSYLMVGVPIQSTNRGNSFLSVDQRGWWKRGWLRVEADDHLGRGAKGQGLHRKLQAYLESQGVDPAQYPHVYLVTSPRFLGYKFSPASFWYLYSGDKKLKAMISEVNNTFDERRMYFHPINMNQRDNADENECGSLNDERLPYLRCPPRRFKHVWPKDFHVSPFNSRKGTYAVSACDPSLPRSAIQDGTSEPFIDIKATLLSTKGRPKMTARLWSTSAPLDPAMMTRLAFTVFVFSWWWVGLMTYPRILVEAVKLAFRRGLSIYYRPEVKQGTIARTATAEEIFISHIFRKYLKYQIARIETPLEIQYYSIDTEARQWIFSTGNEVPPIKASIPTKQFHVLTPAFYSRLVSYKTFNAALAAEVLSPDAGENRTAQASDTGELCALLAQASLPDQFSGPMHQDGHRSEPLVDRIAWRLVACLRREAEAGSYPSPGHPQRRGQSMRVASDPSTSSSANNTVPVPHFLDVFVRQACSPDECRTYRRTLLRLFLADRVALGSMALLQFYRLVFQVLLVGIATCLLGRVSADVELVLEVKVWQGLAAGFLCVGWGWLESFFL